jgi:hypothetical protein
MTINTTNNKIFAIQIMPYIQLKSTYMIMHTIIYNKWQQQKICTTKLHTWKHQKTQLLIHIRKRKPNLKPD